jgi:hypothetical protein
MRRGSAKQRHDRFRELPDLIFGLSVEGRLVPEHELIDTEIP